MTDPLVSSVCVSPEKKNKQNKEIHIIQKKLYNGLPHPYDFDRCRVRLGTACFRQEMVRIGWHTRLDYYVILLFVVRHNHYHCHHYHYYCDYYY